VRYGPGRRLACLKPKTVLREQISQAGRPLGTFVSASDPAITDILGGAGYDFIIIDNEHGPLGVDAAQHHVRAAEASGIIPMVRVGQNEPNIIGKFLDVGCQGIIVPHVNTVDDAERVVAATRFSPAGVRGMCPASHAAGYRGGDTTTFTRNAEEETLVGVIIESALGVANVEQIAAVEGLDIIFFGPGDLSHELGVVAEGWESVEIQEAWNKVKLATKTAGKWLMAITLAGRSNEDIVVSARRLFDQGADLVTLYVELLLFQGMMEDLVRAKLVPMEAGAPAGWL
jgi:2-keto-3-deoxy-L-rhamnonate aldolase RhmA